MALYFPCSVSKIIVCMYSGGCYCHQLARDDDIIGDKPCFCGYASVLLQSPKHKLKRKDIIHITFENDVRTHACT